MLLRDLIYASRTLRKSPTFVVSTVLTLALGVGASTAVFSVAEAVLLRPLPYKDPAQLVFAEQDLRKRNVKDSQFSSADFFDLRKAIKRDCDEVGAVNTGRGVVSKEDGTPEEVHFAAVTPNFFQMMGATIWAGRDFTEMDGSPQPQLPQAGVAAAGLPQAARLPTIAILSYEYFQRRFGGDRSAIGKPLRIAGGGGPLVVGVLAPGFALEFPPATNVETKPDIWTAARLAYDNAQRLSFFLRPIGRLKKGVNLNIAQQDADFAANEIRKISAIENTADMHIRLEPMQQYVVANARPAILALMGAGVFLLLIACANVANLMLVRISMRERELAIRTSLGGGWWQLALQALTEALVVSAVGTALGIGLAWFGIHELLVIAPEELPRLEAVHLGLPSLLFASLAGLFSAGLSGFAPAFHATRSNLMSVLRGSSRTASMANGAFLRNCVVVAEVALCFVLLIGSGLMVRSFLALQQVNAGYDANHLLTFQLLRQGRQTPEQQAAFIREVQQRLAGLPGVQGVTAANPFPLTGGFFPIRWGLAPALADASKFRAVDPQTVLPGYFETMRTPLLAGRPFTEADNAPERNLVVIDETLAAKAFPNASAVGQRILIRARTPEPEWVEVIGVVAHQRTVSLAEPGREQLYFTDGFFRHGAVNRWAMRTSGDPVRYMEAVRGELSKIDSHLLIRQLQPMQVWVRHAQANTRFSLLLMGVFAAIAGSLAAVGLYGVLSTAVRQRTAEIGVRMALGAQPENIFKLIVGSGIRLSVLGIAIGLAAALGLTRLITSMLVGVEAADPVTFAIMIALFLVIAALSSWIPARRAAGLVPTTALRAD
jgi:predicted permease